MPPSGDKTMTEKKIWSMDELVALTDEVQEEEVEFRDKVVQFQFCELTEKEEPKFTGMSDSLSEEEKMSKYQELGMERCIRMLAKANEKNPDGPIIVTDQWDALPTTLRYTISNKILGVEADVAENFTT